MARADDANKSSCSTCNNELETIYTNILSAEARIYLNPAQDQLSIEILSTIKEE